MPKCSEVASELRKLADALDSTPEAEIVVPYIFFSCTYGSDPKGHFLNAAKVMLRPFTKKYTDTEIELLYKSDAMDLTVKTKRSAVCELVEPAKPAVYRCEPLLSDEEDAAISTEAVQ